MSRHFRVRHFAGLLLPDLSDGNLSQFEDSEITALDSYYAVSGVDAEYRTAATGATRWVRVLIKTRVEQSEQDGSRLVQVELLTVLIRRYGVNGVEFPAIGDRMSLVSMGQTRVYTLTDTPLSAVGQLEYQVEFARSVEREKGTKTRLV